MRTLLFLALVPATAMAAAPRSELDRPEAAAGRHDQVICKRFTEIGSLIASRKICRTKRDWENERANLSMRDPIGSCAGGSQGGFCGQ